mgnify:FL=1
MSQVLAVQSPEAGNGRTGQKDKTVIIPPMPERQTAPLSLLQTARVLRRNPVEILPVEAFEFTRISTPFFGKTVHTLSGPEEMKSVLLDEADAWRKSPLVIRMLRPVLGESILTAHDSVWKKQRKALQPGFLKARILALVPAMAEAARAASQSILAAGPRVDVTPALNNAAISVIEYALFTEATAFDRNIMRKAVEDVFEGVGRTRYSDLLPLHEGTPRLMGLSAQRGRRVMRTALMKEISARRLSGNRNEDLLQLLLDARDPETGAAFKDSEVRDNLISLVAAGHETTAIALTWALYLLAIDPATQDRAADEVRNVVGDGDITPDNVMSLTFIRQVLEETMRLYPPAPIIGRRAIRDSQIAERSARRGDIAIIAFYAMQRHPRFWDNPDSFDPDRFSPERRPTDPWVYRPFGGGPRACIGNGFAMTEAMVILATLLRDMKFAAVHGHPVKPVMTITFRPEGGLPLDISPRH